MEHTYRTNILFLLLLYASSSSSSCHTGRPAVLSQDTYFLPSDASATPISSYLAERALNPGCNNNDNAFWLGPEHVSGASFVLDYGDGAPVEADGFYLRNARNFAGDRSTRQFRVEVALDLNEWSVAVDASFPGPFPPPSDCEPTLFFAAAADAPIFFRYVRFTAVTYYNLGAALQFIAPRQTVAACTDTKVLMEDTFKPHTSAHAAANALTDQCSNDGTNTTSGSRIWISDHLTANELSAGFLLDFGAPKDMVGVKLRNDINWPWNGRGTKGFRILLSNDLQIWEETASGQLDVPSPEEVCGELELFAFDEKKSARYMRFMEAVSHHMNGPALAYIAPMEGSNCEYEDLSFPEAHVLETHSDVNSKSGCLELCKVVETCGSATWMSAGSNHKSCRLISRAALNTKDEMVALSNAVTTLRYCQPGCTVHKVDSYFHDIPPYPLLITLEDCQVECLSTPDCSAAVFVASSDSGGASGQNGKCYRKRELSHVASASTWKHTLVFPNCEPITCPAVELPLAADATPNPNLSEVTTEAFGIRK